MCDRIGNNMINHDTKNEILSPAGSVEALYAAVNAGADAVYIGGQRFGARAYAQNPNNDELLRAMDYIHIHNKKMYLTVNTLLKSEELEEQLYDYLMPLYINGLDAVIVQDIGAFHFIRKHFTGLDLHASTQMTVTGTEGAALLKKLGASRIVTARELSLSELRQIHDSVDIEIESFIHGAMCYCYSGMCLFSSMVGGRSGNRGRCAGPCRQPYEVYKYKKRFNDNNTLYALSLKDMNTLEIIPDIIDCGVYSLKIEGRMKSPEYAAAVVSIYRKYVDLYNEKGREHFKIDKADMQHLMELYTRSGSTTGYYKCHNSRNMISFNKPAYKSVNDDYISEIHKKYCDCVLKRRADAQIILNEGEPMRLTVSDDITTITVVGKEAGTAVSRPIERKNVLKQMKKTGDSFIEFSGIDIELGDNVFAPVSHLNELRREGIRKFENHILSEYRRGCPNSDTEKINADKKRDEKNGNDKNYDEKNSNDIIETDNTISISCQINTFDQLSCALRLKEIQTICIATDIFSVKECINAIKRVLEAGRECYVSLPYIYRESGRKYVKELIEDINALEINSLRHNPITFLIKNVDELGLMLGNRYSNFAVDSSLYAFNRYSKDYYYRLGAKRVTLPYELNFNELKNLAGIKDELIVYGRVPLMVTAGCVNKNFDRCTKGDNDIIELKDRKGAYFTNVCCCNFCYNIIYNCVPVSLLGVYDKVCKLNTKNYRINLTTEDYTQAMEVLEKCIKIFYYKEYCDEPKNFTRGHFNRGVE